MGLTTQYEGVYNVSSPSVGYIFIAYNRQAKAVFRKRGLVFAPHVATLAGSGIVSGLSLATNPLGAKENIHDRVAEQMAMVFNDVKATATEFNVRGDYGAG